MSSKLCLWFLPQEMSEEELSRVFSKYRGFRGVSFSLDGRGQRVAIVDFSSHECAAFVRTLHLSFPIFPKSPVTIEFFEEPVPKDPQRSAVNGYGPYVPYVGGMAGFNGSTFGQNFGTLPGPESLEQFAEDFTLRLESQFSQSNGQPFKVRVFAIPPEATNCLYVSGRLKRGAN